MKTIYTTLDSPLGGLLVVGERVATAPGGTTLASLSVPGQRNGAAVRPGWIRDPGAFTAIAEQLTAYFAGTLTRFDIRYVPSGSDFQRRVWETLDAIPYGTTLTYGRIAARLGEPPSAARAVGAAMGANPLLVVRPCHRVVGADGSLTGYAGGLWRKQLLLALEGTMLAV
ncbi:methylated-DNA--[protein]-cysteine S-methyltransferase [Micromonospora sagamiensis]|uniref:Methylated-DNA--protein-cysteine methyltransferase n=1 Tax=Micromonospora sagamiensis TaxID=47875 RepID=A0A562WEH7_9ACTN|nr:methylated-DNA--[protein]-cysteine S-methyltransferase [Micromonospora sagamiensis]TWJ28535.1 methylated-DNA-[protein]-cysteine S-methyltransferase [Micromonospora sagamiensis]BCL12564.1 methylated-DNA--protein-cysteine methyltransferase [Micromonospora sagamiensis]